MHHISKGEGEGSAIQQLRTAGSASRLMVCQASAVLAGGGYFSVHTSEVGAAAPGASSATSSKARARPNMSACDGAQVAVRNPVGSENGQAVSEPHPCWPGALLLPGAGEVSWLLEPASHGKGRLCVSLLSR